MMQYPIEKFAGYSGRSVEVDGHAIAYLRQGLSLVEAGRFEDALDIFNQGLEASHRNYDLLIARGDVLQLLDLNSEALQSFKLAISFNPGSEIAYSKLGYALLTTSRYADALHQFRFGLIINSSDVGLLKGVAKALMYSGEHYGAETFLLRASLLDLDDSESPSFIARIRFIAEDFEAALNYAQRSLKNDKKNKLALEIASHTLCELGQYEEAAKHAEYLVKLYPNQPNFRTIYAIILHGTLSFREAVRHIDAAIKLADSGVA